jgi:gliding motility-associated-like protein
MDYFRYAISASICEGESYLGYTMTGIYYDTLLASAGCDSIRTLDLTVLQKPKPNLGVDTILCNGDTLVLTPGKFDTYLWQDGSGQEKFIARQGGLYSVQVTNACGIAGDEKYIREDECEVYFPTAFTPNQDGLNDQFRILNPYKVTDFHLKVYNRWGQLVYESKDPFKGWPGELEGKTQGTGIFVWHCSFKRYGVQRFMKGTVTLIR